MKWSIFEPIPDIWQAADLLSQAVDAHINGDQSRAAALFAAADIASVWRYTDAGWKDGKAHIVDHGASPHRRVPASEMDPQRQPDRATKRAVLARDGHRCRYCGLPVVDATVRQLAHKLYPEAVPWGRKNSEQHAAFQCLWLQYDHVVPHSAGGRSDLDNLVITCAVCNFGKENLSLEQLGLEDPRLRPPVPTGWDGLMRFLQ